MLLNTYSLDDSLNCLSDNLRYYISMLDITLENFANSAQVGISTLVNVVNNRQNTIKLDFVLNCAKFLNCNIDDLLLEKDKFQYIPIINFNDIENFLTTPEYYINSNVEKVKVGSIHYKAFAINEQLKTNNDIIIDALFCIYPIKIIKNNSIFLIKKGSTYQLIKIIDIILNTQIKYIYNGCSEILNIEDVSPVGIATKIIYKDTFI